MIVALEAHPGVVSRTGMDPVECLRLLASIRPFQFFVGETRATLHPDRTVFDQIPPDRVYNILAITVRS